MLAHKGSMQSLTVELSVFLGLSITLPSAVEEPVCGVYVGQDVSLCEAPQEAWKAKVRGATVWNFQGEAEREGD